MKEEIIKELASSGQVTDCSSYVRSEEYKGFWLNDNDAPLVPYDFFTDIKDKKSLKEEMLNLRNEGLVELLPAVDYDGRPNGSGWSLTRKGLEYAVDNNLVIL